MPAFIPLFLLFVFTKAWLKRRVNYIFHLTKNNKSQERVICVLMKWKMGKY